MQCAVHLRLSQQQPDSQPQPWSHGQKPDVKPEIKPEVKPEVKPDVKTDAKPLLATSSSGDLRRAPSQDEGSSKGKTYDFGTQFTDADGNEYLQDQSPEDDENLLACLPIFVTAMATLSLCR